MSLIFRNHSNGGLRNYSLGMNQQKEKINRYSSFKDLSSLLKNKNNQQRYQSQTSSLRSNKINNHILISDNQSQVSKKKDDYIMKKLNPELFRQESIINSSRIKSAIQKPIQNQSLSSISRPSSSYRNATLKVSNLTTLLSGLEAQISQVRSQVLPIMQTRRQLQPTLLQELYKIKQAYKKQIDGLVKRIRIKREVNSQRSKDIWDDINKIWVQNQRIKQEVFQLRMRMQKIQFSMGNQY